MINGESGMMPKYKALFEADLIRIPQDEEIILDQGHIVVINGVPKLTKPLAR